MTHSNSAPSKVRARNRSFRRTAGKHGSTMVEFSLFFLIFLTLVVALFEFGFAMWTQATLTHAARAGARHAIAHGSLNPIGDKDPSVEAVVKSNAVGLTKSQLSVATTYLTTNTRGEVVQVEVKYPYRLVTGVFLAGRNVIQLGTKSRMVIAN